MNHSQRDCREPAAPPRSSMADLFSLDFEIFGLVTGVFFRMHAEQEAVRLGLVGWVKNTYHDTVVGQVQGPVDKVQEMREWLATKGSPFCRIDKAQFNNERPISKLEHEKFRISY
ncbi:acylphosphatase-2-like [Branchiostoma floridae]|uniref:acylphosphatase n=1 Tax=Branchiostoma floridae TaxID=7739 RepID=A0A9J7LQ05_BRAFL|nr:acylphosphatase-2-like [Branchiostoma floridae]